MAHSFPGYRVTQQLYTSQRSTVERAVCAADGETVVIKQADCELVAVEAARRIQHEFDLLRALRGEGVIGVREIVRAGSHIALVIESFGEALAASLAARRFALDEALDLAIALARIIGRIHAAGVVHRDINPQNIVYEPTSRTAKLIDFDIATHAPSTTSDAASSRAFEGTLRYMAPEQTGRLNRGVDARSDLYSLGITLHELFTGQPAVDGDDALAIVHAHIAVKPPRIDAIDPAIPSVVANIVMKLIAKSPEQRYQTAAGLQADLERCRRELGDGGVIEPFVIAQRDVSSRFEFSERLYGREPEVRALLDAFARTARGAVETVLVSGNSGIGKSAVVREVHAPVGAQRGYVASGKFEQLQRDVPYSAVVAAIDELIAQIVADPALDRWRTEIGAAIAGDGPLVHTVLPAIERVLGRQAPPPVLDPETAQRQLTIALARLVQVFARTAHPLVMFLDDMQWADAASLSLLTRLATSEATESLLMIEAFRDKEVDPAHPFALALLDYAKHGAKISRIALAPLELAETAELVADALRLSPDQTTELAAVIWHKTCGNPFFIRQFTQALHDEGYICLDPGSNAFTFDVPAIKRAAITENVAELLAHKLSKLPIATRDMLVTAAAIGNRFNVATLAIVAGLTDVAVHESLAPAAEAGMISPIGNLAPVAPGVIASARYAFQHDRIQQAAYEASSPGTRERLHLEIGRQLLASCRASSIELDARLFDIVHHLERGRAQISDEAERAQLAALALAAARRARRSGACDVAVALLQPAAASRDCWAHYPAWFEIHLELAEVLSQGGLHRDARATVREARGHATPRDGATLDALDTAICVRLGLYPDALACARRAAAVLGVELPADPAELARLTAVEIGIVMAAIAETPIERWIDLPVMQDPDRRAAMALLAHCIPAAYQVEPALMGLIAATLITRSLRHGTCGASTHGFVTFPIVLWTMGQYDAGFRLSKLGVDLARRLGDRALESMAGFCFAVFASPWRRPLSESIEQLRHVIACAPDAGDITHAGYATQLGVTYLQIQGAPLREVIEASRTYRQLCQRLGVLDIAMAVSWFSWHARSWTGAAPGPGELEVDPVATEHVLVASGATSSLATFLSLVVERRFWDGELAGVLEVGRTMAPMLRAWPANASNAEFRFYYCLAAIGVAAAAGERGAPPDGDFAAYRVDLARYAEACPANFGHMIALVDAELARIRGDVAQAIAGYDAAIDGATEHGFLKVETIAHELAARFWIDARKPAFAAVHLGKARDLCEHWGASPRAYELEKRRRSLGAATNAHVTMRSTTGVASTLDFATLVKASHAIASDIVLDSLLVKIMEIIIENTGAQTGSIILASNGELRVHASKQDGTAISVTAGVPLAEARNMSEGIIGYVTRTSERVVLDDATRDPRFRTDPYVRDRRPRSVLCLPIVHKEHMVGAIYLENNLVAGAFTVDRLEALGILVAQLAISIENAVMFSRLEDLVAQRTRALTEANQQLREQAIVRARMESELRLAQKLQAVGQLAAGVAHEINTPIQYVGDSVAFLQDSVASLLALIDAFRGSTDAAAGTIDVAAVRAAEIDLDVDYVRSHAPRACTRALEGIERVSKIVGAMKAFAHPDQHDQAPASVNAVLENMLVVAQGEYRPFADVHTELSDIPDVLCHAGELSQVFLNLVVNAAHAIEDTVRGTEQRGTITVTTRLEGSHVVVSIRDTGGGIPDEIRERVFDPFFTTKGVGRGSGQGLALARAAIVDRHGGTIELETQVGTGTTFVVRIPVRGRVQVSLAS